VVGLKPPPPLPPFALLAGTFGQTVSAGPTPDDGPSFLCFPAESPCAGPLFARRAPLLFFVLAASPPSRGGGAAVGPVEQET
jgi:hypothetical protein